jgi:D-tyrosyl-tRNA(Tyr) deacylase
VATAVILAAAAYSSEAAARDCVIAAHFVTGASIVIDGNTTASIGAGLLALVAVKPADTEETGLRLLTRLLQYRVFADEAGKMNYSLTQTGGELLLVPQFTLAADTHKGLRPGFSGAAPPEQGRGCSTPWCRPPAPSMGAWQAVYLARICRCL